jgi:mono/diheme cytochrome c family protein
MANRSFAKNVMKKTVFGIIVGVLLVIGAKMTHFPYVYQVMFFIYAMLGTLVFILLDAPPMKRMEGIKAVGALVVFYLLLSGLYIAGATILPQFDPEDEKGKIEKVLKLRRAQTEQGKADELLAQAKVLNERVQSLSKRLKSLGAGVQVEEVEPSASAKPKADAGDLVALGKDQYDLQECYNCHKLFGQGGKKRGPELDNIGNLMTPEQIREKIIDPKSWKAEGFDKDFDKGKMPDKYKDLMFPEEIDALVAFLATLKDPSVDTPKPIKMN